MIPLCLVTGFLGSGKTTLLRNLAERHAGEGLVFLVNDFASIDVDGALVEEADQRVVSVAGGSIFCTCLVTEFMKVLGELPERFNPAGVVIEASGIADPRVVKKMLAETGLDQTYALRTILTVVDPGRFLKLIHTLPNIRSQVEAADVVLVNKTDVYPDELIAEAESEIDAIRPGVRTVRTIQARVDVDLFAGAEERVLDGEYARCADPNYATFALPGDGLSVDSLRAAIVQLGIDLYRIKGFLRTKDGLQYVDYAGKGLQVRPATGSPEPGVVVIARGTARDRAQACLDTICDPGG